MKLKGISNKGLKRIAKTIKTAIAMDPDNLERCGYITVRSNPSIEEKFREIGVEVPEMPEQGPMMYAGDQIGSVDNFSGMKFTDKNFVWEHKDLFEEIGFWYTN